MRWIVSLADRWTLKSVLSDKENFGAVISISNQSGLDNQRTQDKAYPRESRHNQPDRTYRGGDSLYH